MKAIIFILFLFFTTIHVKTQVLEFAPVGTKWWYSRADEYPVINPLMIESAGDTLIHSKNCKILVLARCRIL